MSCSEKALEQSYRQSLEVKIIEELAQEKNLDLRIAANIYYRSELAIQISQGAYGIQYLDYHVLVRDLIENESELFSDLL